MQRILCGLLAVLVLVLVSVDLQAASRSILFIGNSFIFGSGSAVRFYRANSVTDLNNEGIGGVPALFKSFRVPSRYSEFGDPIFYFGVRGRF